MSRELSSITGPKSLQLSTEGTIEGIVSLFTSNCPNSHHMCLIVLKLVFRLYYRSLRGDQEEFWSGGASVSTALYLSWALCESRRNHVKATIGSFLFKKCKK